MEPTAAPNQISVTMIASQANQDPSQTPAREAEHQHFKILDQLPPPSRHRRRMRSRYRAAAGIASFAIARAAGRP